MGLSRNERPEHFIHSERDEKSDASLFRIKDVTEGLRVRKNP